ncbi:MAG: alpha/beta fold hydrolase [Mycobacteriales bacterium]
MTEQRVEANGITFHVTEAGDGPPVLLLHGFPDSAELWRWQLPALAAAGYRAIAPDLRGCGRTDRPERVEDYRMRVLVADVAGLLDALGLERVALVGHDWGAGLAWRVAMYAPERVERLAVVSVGHPRAGIAAGMPQHQLSWYMLWFLFPGVAERVLPADDWALYREWAWAGAERGADEDLERQIAALSRPGALTAGLNWYRANIRPDTFVARDPAAFPMPPVSCPVLGVWSSADPALGEDQMRRSAEFVAGPFRYERIDGVDHWVPVHAAEPLNALLLDFLATRYGG